MKQMLPSLLILFILSYALYLSMQSKKTRHLREKKINPKYSEHIAMHRADHSKEELEQLQTSQYAKAYVISVINHGSNQFDFSGGEMEGGFASPDDAHKIACYVLELSGKKCEKGYEKDASMFFSSNCAGCHGDDGKGLNGTYPDLTRKKLLGLEKKRGNTEDHN